MSQSTDANQSSTDTSSDADTDAAFHAIIESSIIREYFDPLDTLADETRVDLRPGEIHSRMQDPAKVAMADVALSSDAFDHYEVGEEGIRLGVKLERMKRILGFADDPDDLVEFELDAETRRLTVRIGESFEWEISLVDPTKIRAEPDAPTDLPTDTAATIEGRDYSRAVEAADMTADFVALEADAATDEFRFEGADDLETTHVRFGSEDRLDDGDLEAARSLFSVPYLSEFDDAIDAGDEVRVELGTDVPTRLGFDFADGAGEAEFVLAPRLDTSED